MFELVNEVYDSESKMYILTFECDEEIRQQLVEIYGKEDFEDDFSEDFSNYILNIYKEKH